LNEKGTPLLLAVLAALAVTQAPRLVPAAGAAKPAGAAAGTEGGVALSSAPVEHAAWKEPLRLYREFFGLSSPSTPPSRLEVTERRSADVRYRSEYQLVTKLPVPPEDSSTLGRVRAAAAEQGVALQFLVVLVPDPIDSNLAAFFDQSVEALQMAFARDSYLPDRFWLPWAEDSAARDHTYRTAPGLLLFRRGSELLSVLLVGETPKQGVHQQALREAFSLIAALQGSARSGEPLRILGPSFSGSARSLQRTLHAGSTYRIVTGSATAEDLESLLNQPERGWEFQRTVLSDQHLENRAREAFQALGWDLSRIAMLSELDTAYGSPDRPASEVLSIRAYFPSGMASIRSAWEQEEGGRGSAENPIQAPQSTLELRLTDESQPVDIVPQFSRLTPAINDLGLSNLLAEIQRQGARYLGLLASDPRDKIFLAERVRRFAPDLVLFTYGSDLIYAHPQYSEKLDGMLVVSTFSPRSDVQAIGKNPQRKRRNLRQFTSEFQQGVYLAARRLLSPKERGSKPRDGWLSAVGGGSLWPLANLADRPLSSGCSSDSHVKLLFLLALLSFFAFWLEEVRPPLFAPGARVPLALGASTLLVLGSGLTVLEVLTLRQSDGSWCFDFGFGKTLTALFLAGLAALYGWLLVTSTRLLRSRGASWMQSGSWIAGALLLLPGASLFLAGLRLKGSEGSFELLELRFRTLSNGLSLLPPFGLLGLSVVFWSLFEVHRHRLLVRQKVGWPLGLTEGKAEPALQGCASLAKVLDRLLLRSFPAFRRGEGRRFWLVFLAAIALPLALFLLVVQPLCEPRWSGWIFIGVLGLCAFLGGAAFCQFFVVWRTLELLLRSLEHSSLQPAFRRIAAEVDWNPMRNFGWKVESLKMLRLSCNRLATLRERWRYFGLARDPEEKALLCAVFEAHRTSDGSGECEKRDALNDLFAKVCQTLQTHAAEPEVEEFCALRLVAYLRPIFSSLRNLLTAALVSSLCVLFAVSLYAFEPQRLLTAGLWLLVSAGSLLALWGLFRIDRNACLSAISGTDPGKVTLDRHFFFNIVTYGLIPFAGVAASQFPGIGRWLGGLLNPMLRVAGGG
jgi:hypothetical protein